MSEQYKDLRPIHVCICVCIYIYIYWQPESRFFLRFRELIPVPFRTMLRSAARSKMKVSSCTTGELVPVPPRRSKDDQKSGTGNSSPVVREVICFSCYVFSYLGLIVPFIQKVIENLCGYIGATGANFLTLEVFIF